MSVKKARRIQEARLRRTYGKLIDQMERCPNPSCQALNSPNAKICWKCGVEFKEI